MQPRESRAVILYEDTAHESFARHLAKRLGIRPQRFVRCHNNVGVLQKLGREVDALRQRNYQRSLCLLVMIDADHTDHARRVAEVLGRIAKDSRDGARHDGERIALLIPAWEIESWYVHLCVPAARPIDEGKDYKMTPEWRALEKNLGAAARRALEAWPADPGRIDPPSLVAARAELTRV